MKIAMITSVITLPSNVMCDNDVGMTWEEAHRRCPEGVVPACHNSLDGVTVSGPTHAVTAFISELQKEGVFAKAVNSSGIAFHSSCMLNVAPALKQRLQQVSSLFCTCSAVCRGLCKWARFETESENFLRKTERK